MSKSFLSHLLESSAFRNGVSDLAIQAITDRDCTAYPGGAATPGTIVDYEFTAPMAFGPPEGEGMRFHIPFEGRGVASGQCKTSEGEDYTYARDGVIAGKIRLKLGPDTLVTVGMEQILESVILEISFDEINLDDESPTQGPPEKFAGEA